MTEQMNVPKLRFGEFKSQIAEPKKLGQLVDMKSGNTPSKSNPNFWGGAIPWISASSMKGNVFSESEQNVTQLALENGAKLASKGSLLLLVRGSMLFNKVPVGFAGRDVTYNQDVKAINLKNGDDNSYLFHWFKANEYKLLSMVTGTGIGAGKLDSEELLSLPFPQPKLEEQQKISSFLSKVDEKIALLTEKKGKLTEYKQGLMQQLFNGKWEKQDGQLTFIPPTLRFKADDGSEFPDWEEKTLGDVAEFKDNQRLPLSSEERQQRKGAYRYYGASGVIDYVDDFLFDGEFVLLGEDGANILTRTTRLAFVATGQFWVNNHAHVLRANGNAYFLAESLELVNYERYNSGTAQPKLNAATCKKIKLTMPCVLEQTKIANFLAVIDKKIDLANSELEKAKEWKKGLLQQMFV